MQDQKLIQLLQSFSPTEHLQFAKFLDSPLHNQRADCVALYRLLKSGLAGGLMPGMQQLHAELFPDTAYDGAALRLSMNYLLRRAERFLALRELLADEAALELRVLDIYRRRKLPKLFEGQLIRIRNLEKAGLPENEDYFLRQYALQSTLFNTVSERSQASEEALQKLGLAMDQYFILLKLKAACSALTMHKLFPSSHSDPLLPVLVSYVETHRLHEIPAIGLFYAAYQLLAGEHAGHAFAKLKRLLPRSTQIFADEDCRALHRIALNHCIRQINGGDRQFLVEAFDLYVQGLENRALLENASLSPWTYKNIAAAGLRTGQLAWVAQFIETYRDQVPSEFRDAFYHYNLAELALAQGEFSAVVRHLRDLSFKDPFMTLNARVLQIKAHFEQGEYKLIEYLLPNLKALLRRRALQSYHRENYRKFVHYLGALLNLPPGDKATAQRLMAEMEAEAQLNELEWLCKQVEAVAEL
jgi:hypothetical protein